MCVGAHALLRARACSCVRLRSAVLKERMCFAFCLMLVLLVVLHNTRAGANMFEIDCASHLWP